MVWTWEPRQDSNHLKMFCEVLNAWNKSSDLPRHSTETRVFTMMNFTDSSNNVKKTGAPWNHRLEEIWRMQCLQTALTSCSRVLIRSSTVLLVLSSSQLWWKIWFQTLGMVRSPVMVVNSKKQVPAELTMHSSTADHSVSKKRQPRYQFRCSNRGLEIHRSWWRQFLPVSQQQRKQPVSCFHLFLWALAWITTT